MNLTKQQEEQLFQQYEKAIWRVVHHFQWRMSKLRCNRDDLFQESALVFLDFVRKAENEDSLKTNFPFRDMVNAMCRYALGDQLLSYPKRTTDFTKIITSTPEKHQYEDVDLDETMRAQTAETIVDLMTIRDFLATLSEEDREIVTLKAKGLRNRDVGKRLHYTDVQMTRKMKSIKEQYLAYVA